MTSTALATAPDHRGIGTRRPIRRRRRPALPSRLTRPSRLLWQHLAYRLRGDRYGQTPLTDPANVHLVIVEDAQ